jgi:hypothetical protein
MLVTHKCHSIKNTFVYLHGIAVWHLNSSKAYFEGLVPSSWHYWEEGPSASFEVRLLEDCL